MTFDAYDFDGYIELDRQEIARLQNGEKFVTVIRPVNQNSNCVYGHPGDTLGATESGSLRPQYNLKVVSNFFANGKLILVLARLSDPV
jgi:hypothetical protein